MRLEINVGIVKIMNDKISIVNDKVNLLKLNLEINNNGKGM